MFSLFSNIRFWTHKIDKTKCLTNFSRATMFEAKTFQEKLSHHDDYFNTM